MIEYSYSQHKLDMFSAFKSEEIKKIEIELSKISHISRVARLLKHPVLSTFALAKG